MADASASGKPVTRLNSLGGFAEELDRIVTRLEVVPRPNSAVALATGVGERTSAAGAGYPSNHHVGPTAAAESFPGRMLGGEHATSPRLMQPRSQLQLLEQRCEAADEALAQSQKREAAMGRMLDEAKVSLHSLGEEADHECEELQNALHLKQAELDDALSEARSGNADAPACALPTTSTNASAEFLIIEELRTALATSQAECAAAVNREVAMQTECAEMRRELDEYSSMNNSPRSIYHREAERRALREEVANLKTEARAMWESQDEVWKQHNISKERLVADVAEIRRLITQTPSHVPDASLQADAN